MTDLWHALHKSEYSYLKIVAEQWGLAFDAPDARQGVEQLVDGLLDREVLEEVGEQLSQDILEALIWLDRQGGRIPWDQFIREYGEIRQMGSGRLDREKPHQSPISTGEELWYRALVARGFFETESGPQEFAYLPEDLRQLVMPLVNPERKYQRAPEFICRVAAPRERKIKLPASRQLLDHLCSLLAGIRMDLDPRIHLPDGVDSEEAFYRTLAHLAGLLTPDGRVSPDHLRHFFELTREDATRSLWDSWRESTQPGEINQVPSFRVEGDLTLDHRAVRESVLDYLLALAPGEWWSLESFIAQVKERDPDIFRSGGEYDSWFIRRAGSDEYMTGFQHWNEVEGAILRYFITGPLRWLGLVDLGAAEEAGDPLAFRLTGFWGDFISGQTPAVQVVEPDPVRIRSQGEIRMTSPVPHRIRYQIARFCDWLPVKAEAYHYRISPDSLIRAEEQGLRVAHLLSLLQNHAEAIPPNILAALQRWEGKGTQAEIASKLVMRVSSPEVLKSLQKTRAKRYIIEQLGPTTAVLRPGSQEQVAQALVELGFFARIEDQQGSQT